jgi:hypothetical protein
MFIVSRLVPMCWDPKELHCFQPSVCMADLLASLFVLLCSVSTTSLLELFCWWGWWNWRFFKWIAMSTSLWSWWRETHSSHISPDLSWVIRMSFLFCLRPQISNLNIHGYVRYCKSYYNHNLIAEGMSIKPEIMCSCNLKLLIHLDNLLWFGTYL